MLPDDSIAAIIVTFKRNDCLRKSLESVVSQIRVPDGVIVVDNAESPSTKELAQEFKAVYVAGGKELGGAGGFARGISHAFEMSFSNFWLLDDDGFADSRCLEELWSARTEGKLEVVSPLSISLEDSTVTANPIVVGFRKVESVALLKKSQIILNKAQFFNGVLLSRKVVELVGLPDPRLFIRGDEVDYALRCLQRFQTGLVTSAIYHHPSSDVEFGGKRTFFFSANVPLDPVKRFYQFRNRGYLVREYHKIGLGLYDWIRYPLRFLFTERLDIKGLLNWSKTWIKGFRRDLTPYSPENIHISRN
jgi:rhamnopyranosyl-N-acetylglucosaminyl-diphospho-decaprenol beta-1,3/1,4-galactofuranosyltransferase